MLPWVDCNPIQYSNTPGYSLRRRLRIINTQNGHSELRCQPRGQSAKGDAQGDYPFRRHRSDSSYVGFRF